MKRLLLILRTNIEYLLEERQLFTKKLKYQSVNTTIIVDQYKKRKTGPGIALSKNKEIDNYCNTSKETIDAIIERKNKDNLILTQ